MAIIWKTCRNPCLGLELSMCIISRDRLFLIACFDLYEDRLFVNNRYTKVHHLRPNPANETLSLIAYNDFN